MPDHISGKQTRVAVMYFTRDKAAVSGNVSYTGVGFQPKAILFNTHDGTNNYGGPGKAVNDGGTIRGRMLMVDENTLIRHYNGTCCGLNNSGTGAGQYATLDSFDVDGFTLAWVKAGVGSANDPLIIAICLG